MNVESNYETQSLSGEEALEKVRDLLKHFRSAMMLTTAHNGQVHARPMGIQGEAKEFDGVLWFFSDRDAQKIREIDHNPAVSLILQSDEHSAYMHLFGNARMVDDKAKMKELYSPMLKTWFPDGLDDPRMTLIRFDVDRGDFWDSPGGMLQVLGAFTKAIVTGERAQGGEIGKVTL